MPQNTDGHGFDWQALLKMAAPLVGGIAGGGDGGGAAFMDGYQRGALLAKQEQDRKKKEDQQKNEVGAKYLLDVGTHAQSIDDPLAFADFVNLAEQAGTHAGYMKPGDLKGKITFSENKKALAQLKELDAALEKLSGNGYNLDELAQSGSLIPLKDGRHISIADALDLTRKRPIDAAGKPVSAPKKVDTAASTDYGRGLARYARGLGTTVDALTFEQEKEFKKQFNQSDDPTKTPPKDPSDRYTLEFNDLVDLWKEGHPGQQPGPAVRSQLRQQATKNIGQADDRPRPAGSERGANGLLPGQEFTITEKLAKSWTDTTKSTREMTRQFGLMQTGLKRFREGDKNGGSQGVLVTFQKILDPTSVVRESEYARTATGQSLMNRIEGYVDKLRSGGAGMTDGELSSMVETARQFLNDMGEYSKGQRKRIEAQVKKYGLDPATVFDDVLTGGANGSAPPTAATTPKKIGRFEIVSVK